MAGASCRHDKCLVSREPISGEDRVEVNLLFQPSGSGKLLARCFRPAVVLTCH
jgi:hypothetical protein